MRARSSFARVLSGLAAALCFVVSGVLVPACAQPKYQYDRPARSFDDPLPGGTELTRADLASTLAFRAVWPERLGVPAHILVSGQKGRGRSQFVILVYRSPDLGPLLVDEAPYRQPPGHFHEAATSAVRQNGKPYLHGSAAIVRLKDGTEALRSTAPDGKEASISWVKGAVYLTVSGPNLAGDKAVIAADRV